MNKEKLKQLNIILILISLTAIVFIGLFVFVFSPQNAEKTMYSELIDYNDGWILKNYEETDKIVDLPVNVDAKQGDIVTIVNKVPEGIGDGDVLVFRTEFQNVLVTIGDKKVYSSGIITDQKMLKTAVPCYNIVPLEGAKPGELITIYLASGYNKYSGHIKSVKYGSRGDVVSSIVKNNGISFVVSAALLVVTILLLVSVIFMRNIHVDKPKAIYAFAFVLISTIWNILQNPVMEIVTTNHFGVYMSGMVMLLLMPIFYIMYQRCFAIKRRYAKIFEIGLYVFGINFLTGVVFQMMDICDFATYIIITKIIMLIGLILLSGIMYLAADTYNDKSIYSNLAANIIITVAALLEGIFSFFAFYSSYDGIILQVGEYIFLILLVVIVEKNIIAQMRAEQENAFEEASTERDRALKNINSNLIVGALNVAVDKLKDKDKETCRLIYDASVYMKHNINVLSDDSMVPFKRELEYIKAYLGIQRKRNENLEVVVEDKVISFNVPYNTIEPLVENAVVNGALRAEADGRIVVRSYERLDCFAIQIVDNGRGIGPDKKFHGKVNFKDIKRKLKTTCGGVIEVKNKPGKGTIVTVKLPKTGYIVKE